MSFPDLRTIFLLGMFSLTVCASVLIAVWMDTRRRFVGTGHWAADFVCQTVGAALMLLRGVVPDWISVVVGNALVAGGSLLGYDGLLRFAGRRGLRPAHYALPGIPCAVLAYFLYVRPNLDARSITVSVWLTAICVLCAWLALGSATGDMRRAMRGVGLVFSAFALVSVLRVVLVLAVPTTGNDFYRSSMHNIIGMIAYYILLIALAFGFVQVVSRRLLSDIGMQEAKFAKAFRSSPYAITLTRASDGTILEVNESFTRLTDFSYAEAVGSRTLALGLWHDPADRDRVASALAAGEQVYGEELLFRSKSGRTIVGLFSAEVIEVNGESCILSSISDISARREAEDALREKSNELQRFTRALSHDLRSPLTTLSAFLRLLDDDIAARNEDKVRDDIAFMSGAVDRMGRLTDELSELSRIGRIDSEPTDVSLQEVVREAANLVAGRTNARGIKIDVTDEPIVLHGDRPRLASLYMNLLDNAAKFIGDRPDPRIEVGVEDADDELVLFVRDNGIGIDPEAARSLFAPFVRLDPRIEGTGLGLTIVRRVVEVHGGRIWMESDGPGTGSTFRFTLAGTRRAREPA